jgi:hypothetical protein
MLEQGFEAFLMAYGAEICEWVAFRSFYFKMNIVGSTKSNSANKSWNRLKEIICKKIFPNSSREYLLDKVIYIIDGFGEYI